MIDRQEVMELTKEFGLAPHVIEKDYVLGWLLQGISNHTDLSKDWVFKGGTCLKKCFFETYRFSEDLDFTLTNANHLNQDFLIKSFQDIVQSVYEISGIEIPRDDLRFEVYENTRGGVSAEGRIYYRGPMQRRGNLARIKLDLTDDEVLVLEPVVREVHHPYTDKPDEGIHVQCYCYEEVFAEKIRALAERTRPRDLYDVVHLYRHDNMRPDRTMVINTLSEKCEFKGIPVPTMVSLENSPDRSELETEWENMLAHQLLTLPPFEQFWLELPKVFDWLHKVVEKVVPPSFPVIAKGVDTSWQPPAMAQAWHTNVPLEVIRFAASNRLCVDLKYQGTDRLIEPYSLRRTSEGNLLLHVVKHNTGEPRSYRVDRIQGATATKVTFVPKYTIELTSAGPVSAPSTVRRSSGLSVSRRRQKSGIISSSPRQRKSSFGPTYVIECSYCEKKFNRKKYSTNLNPHKDKQGYPCSGRTGYMVDTKY